MRAVPNRTYSRRSRAVALSAAGDQSDPKLELSSLVDVAFLLLTFFLLTSTLEKQEADIALKLSPFPKVLTPDQNVVIPEDCLIEITADGVVRCDEAIVDADADSRDLPNLLRHVESIRAADRMSGRESSTRIIVNAADEVPSQRLVDVMNCLTKAGVSNVVLEGFRD